MQKKSHLLELYSDYLLAKKSQATATGLSRLTNDQVSHDRVTRFLNKNSFDSKDLWGYKNSYILCDSKKKDGVLILDDTIEEKPHTKENNAVCWHYDHSKSRMAKGINILTCMFSNMSKNLPVSYEVITKTESYKDEKTGKQKRRSQETKNEKFRRLIYQSHKNKVPFKHVLADSWYGSKDNIN